VIAASDVLSNSPYTLPRSNNPGWAYTKFPRAAVRSLRWTVCSPRIPIAATRTASTAVSGSHLANRSADAPIIASSSPRCSRGSRFASATIPRTCPHDKTPSANNRPVAGMSRNTSAAVSSIDRSACGNRCVRPSTCSNGRPSIRSIVPDDTTCPANPTIRASNRARADHAADSSDHAAAPSAIVGAPPHGTAGSPITDRIPIWSHTGMTSPPRSCDSVENRATCTAWGAA